MRRLLILGLILAGASANAAVEPAVQRVAEGVYALVGPTGPRSYDNDALNANLGFVVTAQGVVLIDSGATVASGPRIDAAIHRVTPRPVRWVINTGSQDHRWLGNGYFADRGAEIIALARTVRTQRRFADQELDALRPILKERLADTRPVHASRPLPGDKASLVLGGTAVELHWFGDAHFPGDAVVWLPRERVLFSGDLIFADRMLGVLPWSSVQSWRRAFHRAVDALRPEVIVPGHGAPCGVAKARRDTGDYLDWLVGQVQPAVERWEGLEATVNRLGADRRWAYLQHFDSWHRTNLNRAYVQLENGESGEGSDR